MEYTKLGRSGLSVSRLCLGTMNFGWTTPEDEAADIMDGAHDLGINFFDTANVYGGPLGGDRRGCTEEVIGRWFARGGRRRERTVVATKVFQAMGSWPNEGGLSALNIRHACDASLRRLQTDHIDLYQMHHVDRSSPWDEIWEAMEVLRYQGKILYVGSSNFGGWHLAKAQERATQRSILGLVSEQSLYNLLERTVELEVLPATQDYGLGVLPWSPLHGGLLGGIVRQVGDGLRRLEDGVKAIVDAHYEQLTSYEDVCEKWGETPSTVALAWLLSRPAVTAPIIGPRTVAQLEHAHCALDLRLDDEQLAVLDEIFPGHQPAPEDYAW